MLFDDKIRVLQHDMPSIHDPPSNQTKQRNSLSLSLEVDKLSSPTQVSLSPARTVCFLPPLISSILISSSKSREKHTIVAIISNPLYSRRILEGLDQKCLNPSNETVRPLQSSSDLEAPSTFVLGRAGVLSLANWAALLDA